MIRKLNWSALVKENGEVYLTFWKDGEEELITDHLDTLAADDELSFTFHDAAVLSKNVLRQKEENQAEDAEQWSRATNW